MTMTAKAAAGLATVAYIATSVAGVLIITEPTTLGVTANTLTVVAGWLALGGSVMGFGVVAIRRNLLPGVETGIGKEPQPGTDSITVTETHTPGG